MKSRAGGCGGRVLAVEPCEERALLTLVFVFNGSGFGSAKPSILTADAARVLHKAAGAQVVQLANPPLGTPGALHGIARQIESISHGQPIGIVGFSAGGTLALHLAADPKLHVKDVLAYYSPPDVKGYLAFHGRDHFSKYILGHGRFSREGIDLLSGPSPTTAHVVAAYGLRDHNVVADESEASFRQDFPAGVVYKYDGPHGVSISQSPAALEDFLAHL